MFWGSLLLIAWVAARVDGYSLWQLPYGIGLRDLAITLAITGVNIDEESILMISYQRAFQASSRVILAASEMLELLVTL